MNLGEREAADNASTLTAASAFATISNGILFILSVMSSCFGPRRFASTTLPRQADGFGVGSRWAELQRVTDAFSWIPACCSPALGRFAAALQERPLYRART